MIITLCGSTKFKDKFMEINREFTLCGDIVLMPGVFGHTETSEPTVEQKKKLDTLHKRKIAMSDKIFVINERGYVGESTASEIAFAESLNIPVDYLEVTQ